MRVGYNPKLVNIKTDVPRHIVDMAFIAHVVVVAAAAVAASNVGVLAATALTAAPKQITAALTNPAVPRSIKVKGNAAGNAGNVVIHGTNYADLVISESIALNGITAVEGNKAFKTVTQVDLPAETHAGTDTVSIGWGEKLGLPYLLSRNTVQMAFLNNVIEVTAPAVTISPTVLEDNTFDLNSALNGTQVDLYLVV